MSEAVPTEREIRAMEGPSLTCLAFQLGLGPREAYSYEEDFVCLPHGERIRTWRPHARLDDADAVLRLLGILETPVLGWHVHLSRYTSREVPRGRGIIEAARRIAGVFTVLSCSYPTEENPTEAIALLRCACLARAVQLREAHP